MPLKSGAGKEETSCLLGFDLHGAILGHHGVPVQGFSVYPVYLIFQLLCPTYFSGIKTRRDKACEKICTLTFLPGCNGWNPSLSRPV